eukprot:3080248-Pleurochrysis_carterae.AAC.1
MQTWGLLGTLQVSGESEVQVARCAPAAHSADYLVFVALMKCHSDVADLISTLRISFMISYTCVKSDKCGDDSLYLPAGGGRPSSANQSRYTYRISLQTPHTFGKLWELSLILPMVKTGANFGATTFFTSLVRLMRNTQLPLEKRRL